MSSLYSLRRGSDGWTVYEVSSGRVLTLDGQEQAGLSLEQAERVADRLNGALIDLILSSAANDRWPQPRPIR